MQPSFNLKLPFFPLGGFKFSFKVYTASNVYYICRENLFVKEEPSSIIIERGMLVCEEEGAKSEGVISTKIYKDGDEIKVSAKAEHSKSIRSISLVVAGIFGNIIESVSSSGKTLFPFNEVVLEYPKIFTPLVFLSSENTDKRFFFRCEDEKFSLKKFIFRKDEVGTVLAEIVCLNNNPSLSRAFTMPLCLVGQTTNKNSVIKHHDRFLSIKAHIKEKHEKKPSYPERISLIARFHLTHATGHRFLTFETAKKPLEYLASRVEKNSMLVKLSAWEGSYYKEAGSFLPDACLGGKPALLSFIEKAKSLGVLVGLEVSIKYASAKSLSVNGMLSARSLDMSGRSMPAPKYDFLGSGSYENNLAAVSLADNNYRAYVKERLSELLSLGVNAIFLADTHAYERERNGCFYEGLFKLLDELSVTYPNAFFVSDTIFDLLSKRVAISESANLEDNEEAPNIEKTNAFINKYCLQTYSRLTPNGDGLLGVEPLGYKEVGGHIEKAIPLVNVMEEDLSSGYYVEEVLQRYEKYRASVM